MGESNLVQKLPRTLDGLRRAIKYSRSIRDQQISGVHDFESACKIGFHNAIIELADSIRILIKNRRVFDAQILLRAQFEHLVVLKTLSDSPNHIDSIRLENTKRMTLTMSEAKRGNRYVASIAGLDSLDGDLTEWTKFKTELIEDGVSIRTFTDLCSTAGFKDEYETIYRNLSQHVHPTFSGIIERSLKVDKEEINFEFAFGKVGREGTFSVVLDASIAFLAQANEILLSKTAER